MPDTPVSHPGGDSPGGAPEEVTKDKDSIIADLNEQLTRASGGKIDTARELQFIKERVVHVEKMAGLGKMFVSMANELNNALSGIIGYTQLLLENSECPETMKKDLEVVSSHAHRTHRILKGLLAFSHLQKIGRESINIHDVLDYAISLKLAYLKYDGIEVTTDFSGEALEMMGNPDELLHLFTNLLNNAHQALKHHQGGKVITVKTECRHGIIRVLVSDTGPGVPPSHRDKIFDPFFSTWGEKESLGLGLSICYGIISEHGGSLYYEEGPGGGAQFVVELPLRKEIPGLQKGAAHIRSTFTADMKVPQDKESASSQTPQQDISSKRILLIDDEDSILSMLNDALITEGFEVLALSDSERALDVLDSEDFDLVISDVKMPVVSGIQIYSFIEKKKPHLLEKIVFITGDIIDNTTRSFLKSAGNPYFAKPFVVKQFISFIRSII
ncbi:MAG: hybrid sensor histidine kinase/response regulator [Candidatus Eremiobacteraeota bacterium]|nr:hybrid sensor histidine kinase/response regulator [Candidatus Eremiobacteraeota bacterium]